MKRPENQAASFERLYRLGVQALAEKRLHESEKMFRLAMNIQPDHACLNHLLGKALHSSGQIEEALLYQNLSCKLDPSLGWNWLECGEIYLSQKNEEAALRCFVNASNFLPKEDWIANKVNSIRLPWTKSQIDAFFLDHHWESSFDWRSVEDEGIVEQALIELAAMRAAESNHLAMMFLRLCQTCGLSHPLFDDAEAWICYSQCDFDIASKIWHNLLKSEDCRIVSQIEQTIHNLFKDPSMDIAINRIFMMIAQDQDEALWRKMLCDLWINSSSSTEESKLIKHMKSIANQKLNRTLIDVDTAFHHLLLTLCEEWICKFDQQLN